MRRAKRRFLESKGIGIDRQERFCRALNTVAAMTRGLVTGLRDLAISAKRTGDALVDLADLQKSSLSEHSCPKDQDAK